MSTEEPKVLVSFKQDGRDINLELSLEDAEALGLQLIAQATSRRPKDNRPLHEQQAYMVLNQPVTEIMFERGKDGDGGIGLFFKPNHFRPIKVRFDQERAKEVAYMILNLSGGAKDSRRN